MRIDTNFSHFWKKYTKNNQKSSAYIKKNKKIVTIWYNTIFINLALLLRLIQRKIL